MTARPHATCALSTCRAGSQVTVHAIHCNDTDACRIRALGLCEGVVVHVIRSRGCVLLEVWGARLALSLVIAAGILVSPKS